MFTLRRLLLAVSLMALIATACAPTPSPTPTPTPTATLVPTDTATPLPSATPRPTRTPLPTLTPTDSNAPPTDSPTPLPNQPQVEEGTPPPYTITLPAGWQEGFGMIPVRDGVTESAVQTAIYTGPVPEHEDVTGWIVVLWGFPSLSTSAQPDLWADGLRFLRGALVDSTCTIGTDLSRSFSVGGRDDAVGTFFSAVGCHGESDTAGWFAGLNVYGGNYVFFVYTDPLEGIDTSTNALQRILDTIVWQPVPTRTPEP